MMMKVKIDHRELKFRIPIIVEPDSSSYFAHSPDLKSLSTDGATEEEALKNARVAAKDILTVMIRKGIPVPIGILIWDKAVPPARVAEKGYYEEDIIITLS